jgi:MerR family copper efflux transcriptional regulator
VYIGKIAELTGCTPKAIRLYESLGLLSEPSRHGKYRVYTAHHLDIVRIIRVAQSAGFKLAEMGTLIEEKNRQQRFPLEMANQGIEAKRLQVQAQVEVLKALDERLIDLQREINVLFAEPAQPACTVLNLCSALAQIAEGRS